MDYNVVKAFSVEMEGKIGTPAGAAILARYTRVYPIYADALIDLYKDMLSWTK